MARLSKEGTPGIGGDFNLVGGGFSQLGDLKTQKKKTTNQETARPFCYGTDRPGGEFRRQDTSS